MEEALSSLLRNWTALTALVSTRVHWNVRPIDVATLPAVVLHRVFGASQVTLDGPSGHVESTVQVDCWAHTHEESVSVSRAVIDLLNGFTGIVGACSFQGIFHEGQRQSFEATGQHQSQRFHRVSLDFRIWHSP